MRKFLPFLVTLFYVYAAFAMEDKAIDLSFKVRSFDAQVLLEGVFLEWETGEELNADYFIVERSFNTTDFIEINYVIASGNSLVKTDYNYLDEEVLTLNVQELYYRLKLVNKDGSFTFSKVIMIDKTTYRGLDYLLYPNPASSRMTFETWNPKDQYAKCSIYSSLGELLDEYEFSDLNEQHFRHDFELGDYPSGTYFYVFRTRYENRVIKFRKLD